MNRSNVLIPILLITLVLAVLAIAISYTFQVGSLKPAPTAAAAANPTSSSISLSEEAAEYPDQAHITDGLIVIGILLVCIILFDIAWGWLRTIRSLPIHKRK